MCTSPLFAYRVTGGAIASSFIGLRPQTAREPHSPNAGSTAARRAISWMPWLDVRRQPFERRQLEHPPAAGAPSVAPGHRGVTMGALQRRVQWGKSPSPLAPET